MYADLDTVVSKLKKSLNAVEKRRMLFRYRFFTGKPYEAGKKEASK